MTEGDQYTLQALHTKVDRMGDRLTTIETKMNVWQQMVVPMLTGFVGVVGGILLAAFALRG